MLQNFAREDITLQKILYIVKHRFDILEETVKTVKRTKGFANCDRLR